MIRKIDHTTMGRSQLGWLNSHFHFSFAEYFNPSNMNFGVVRVINDDLIAPGTGFDTHPHENMEIITYVIDGELTHADSMGHEHTLYRGEVQYMSAGTGVFHSEHNRGETTCRLLQIWILPDQKGHTPNYGDYAFKWADRQNNWLHMVSPKAGNAPIKINQDVNFYSLSLDAAQSINFEVEPGRQAYLVLIEGESSINGYNLLDRDALESIETPLEIQATQETHILLIEMAKR